MEVLETLEMQNALSNLEARLDSLEIDIARMTGSRDDDARKITGEMAVMKARVEDALTAFAGTAEELREMVHGVEKQLEQVAVSASAASGARGPVTQDELRAGIDGVMAGVGDVLESMTVEVRERIEALGEQMRAVQDGMLQVAERLGALARSERPL